MIKTRSQFYTIIVLALLAILAGCSERGEPTTELAVEPPLGQLGMAIVPNHYRIELTIDPTKERFSGSVSIDVSVDERINSIWLHGKNLNVTHVEIVDGDGDRVDATYSEQEQSGVALVSLERAVDPGEAALHSRTTHRSIRRHTRCSKSCAMTNHTQLRSFSRSALDRFFRVLTSRALRCRLI